MDTTTDRTRIAAIVSALEGAEREVVTRKRNGLWRAQCGGYINGVGRRDPDGEATAVYTLRLDVEIAAREALKVADAAIKAYGDGAVVTGRERAIYAALRGPQ